MSNPAELRRRLRVGAAAAFGADRAVLEDVRAWLSSVSARELLRIDGFARQIRYEGPTLGKSQQWTTTVLSGPPPVLALASMHPDGYVRERAVRLLAASDDPLSDKALTVRVADHVPVVREAAAREVLRRTSLEQAERIVPLLHLIEQRGRGADVLALYLRALITGHGEREVWARLRTSSDRDLRRAAFKYCLDRAILGTEDAITQLPCERDQVVRRLLARMVADNATPDVVADLLLSARCAESRVLGPVRLTASELDPDDVERLLVDSSLLVRLWARRRWHEMGHDPATTYRLVTRSPPKPLLRARAYVGLAETGTTIDRDEVLELVWSENLALQKVGLWLLADKANSRRRSWASHPRSWPPVTSRSPGQRSPGAESRPVVDR